MTLTYETASGAGGWRQALDKLAALLVRDRRGAGA
jgi:hypothetical protein